MKGELIKELAPQFFEGVLYVEQEYLATNFDCFVCGLKLRDVEEIVAAELEPHFTTTVETDLHELHQPDSTSNTIICRQFCTRSD